MIPRDEAIRICERAFPAGPERLAARLGITVARAPLQGAEGWCVRGRNVVIRVSSLSSPARQRFTLAHELAHVVLGTEPDIAGEPFRSTKGEEREADQLASELLIPTAELRRYLQVDQPVDAKSLARLARAADVSPVMAACRVVSAAPELGLQNAAVVFFVDGLEQWRHSRDLRFNRRAAERLLATALAAKPAVVRESGPDGNVVVGSIIDAQVYQVLLLQLLPHDTASRETREERLRTLASRLFGDDHSFQQSVAACLGQIKRQCQGLTLDVAVRRFDLNYVGEKYCGDRETLLRSADGREYVRLFLERWFAQGEAS